MRVKSFGKAAAGLLLVFSIVMSGPALADKQRGKHRANGEDMFKKFATKLELSDAQVEQLKQIRESHKSQSQQLREQMKSTFTDDQREAMKKNREKRGKKGMRGERPSAEDRSARWSELGVTEAQMQQMKTLREEMKAQHKTMQDEINSVLTPDQQAKLQEMKSNRKGKNKHRRSRGHRGK